MRPSADRRWNEKSRWNFMDGYGYQPIGWMPIDAVVRAPYGPPPLRMIPKNSCQFSGKDHARMKVRRA
jgi:hypothetical protein